MKRLSWISAALAAPLLIVGQARADFTYATSTTPASQTFGPHSPQTSTAQFGATSSVSTLNGVQGISIVAVADQTTATVAATDIGSVAFSDTITINQVAPSTPGMGTLVVNGTISWTRSDTGGQISTFTFNPVGSVLSTTIAGITYTLNPATFGYAQPTVNVPLGSQSAGSISVVISPVPEPASLAMLGVGGLLVAGPRLRRLARSARS